MAFENVLDQTRFTVRVAEPDIPYMVQIIEVWSSNHFYYNSTLTVQYSTVDTGVAIVHVVHCSYRSLPLRWGSLYSTWAVVRWSCAGCSMGPSPGDAAGGEPRGLALVLQILCFGGGAAAGAGGKPEATWVPHLKAWKGEDAIDTLIEVSLPPPAWHQQCLLQY